MTIFANMIAAKAQTAPDQTILTFVDEKAGITESRTYRELFENSHRLAKKLTALGIEKGGAYGVLLQNHPETVEALIAASILGAKAVPVDPRTKGDKLAFVLSNSGSSGVICAGYNLAEVAKMRGIVKGLGWLLVVAGNDSDLPAGAGDYSDIYHGAFELQAVQADSGMTPMQVLYTSGTTGDPKGILKVNAQFAAVMALPEIIGLTTDDVLYTGLSLTHGNAQFLTMGVSLGAGIASVYSRRFTKSRMWDTIRKYGCTVFTLLGGMTAAIYSDPPRADDRDNPVRLVLSAGMPASIWQDFATRYDLRIFEVFGAAEGGLFWNDGSGPVGSFGNLDNNPLHIARIVHDDDTDCGPGEAGELIWQNRSGEAVSVSYLGDKAAAAAKTSGGWFRTGDIVHADNQGWLYFDCRKGGGIRRNGDFVNPGFVEKAVAQVAGVEDVYVYGIHTDSNTPGEKEVVAAVVVADPDRFDVQSVFRQCAHELEGNFIPTFVQLLPEIPKTASEKPQERFLLELFANNPERIYRKQ
ncbi:MAG: ATP-dependent acyl-CoA ligase [Alphaproteobacteria bacterium]|nr:ATP-dependent acyl-CoA ligase [Alphaproteobacteria bacterium]